MLPGPSRTYSVSSATAAGIGATGDSSGDDDLIVEEFGTVQAIPMLLHPARMRSASEGWRMPPHLFCFVGHIVDKE
jgi:hypothetical protein